MPDIEELRYARQIAIPEIGKEGQQKLSKSKVFVVGCGALGSMAAMQLSGAGVGTIGIADFDTIEVSNLQRQFFFNTNEAGNSKAQVLYERIKAHNPEIRVNIHKEIITEKKAREIFKEYDFIIDASDNPDSKLIIGKVCQELNKACCIGGVRDFGGQVITFLPGDIRFEEYFGETDSEGFLPCSLSGVAGPSAVFCSSVQVAEALKYICGIGQLLSGRLFAFNLLEGKFSVYDL